MADAEDERDADAYRRWKQGIPLLYDWFVSHHLCWPSLTCRWGQVIKRWPYKRHQRLYLSQRTDATTNPRSPPNALLVATAELCEWRVAAAEAMLNFGDTDLSQQVKVVKTILHPGEVNKIREVPGHADVVVTHSDSKELFVWHTERQPNRKEKADASALLSVPDLTLVGHTADAEFALGVATAQPLVASGGRDKNVLVWNLADADGGALLARADPDAAEAGLRPGAERAPGRLDAQLRLKGHSDTVEDVVWLPGSAAELASVGDDRALLFWDTRAARSPAARVRDAHGPAHDLHCVDWSALQAHLVATGAADGSVRVWDKRDLARPLHVLTVHVKPTMRMEWSPTHAGVLASGGEDRRICIWDLSRAEGAGDGGAKRTSPLMFMHLGHRGGVADFQWVPSEPADPFAMASVSDNGVGGTLQLWRINDMIWRPEDVVLAEMEEHREYILTAKNKRPAPTVVPLWKPPTPPAAAAGSGPGAGSPAAAGAAAADAADAAAAAAAAAISLAAGAAGAPGGDPEADPAAAAAGSDVVAGAGTAAPEAAAGADAAEQEGHVSMADAAHADEESTKRPKRE